jgi:acetyl esterase/lipase
MPKCLTLLLLVLFSASASAQHNPTYPAVPPAVSFDAVLALPTGTPTSIHSYGTAPSQFAELWLPQNTANEVPIVVFIHGGCWLSAYSIEHSHALATALTQSGYAVWNIEYRRVGNPGGGWPGSLEDIQAAIAALQSLAPPGIDLNTLVLAGHSAGGHLALLAADTTPAIGLAPIVDIATYASGASSCNTAALAFMGATPQVIAGAYQAATPTLKNKDIVLMGSQDHILPAQAQYLPAGYQHWSNAGHFDWIHPGTPAWQEFLLQLRRPQP